MLETTESLLPKPTAQKGKLRVVCVGLVDESLDELGELLRTLDVQVVGRVCAHVRRINPATYVGLGKLEQVLKLMEDENAEAAIFDMDLSPNQLRNVEKALRDKQCLDRSGVIIEIFSQHARTKEAKTQVELARLEYLLPRLAHFWTHFERQRGGIGAGKGMGETQIEVDRRLVKKRMQLLRGRLLDVENERKIQRAGRRNVLKVAIVGYTNAGKSTLINALTDSKVLAENKLFATLDPAVRTLDPHSHPPIVAIDTVGFISRLPTALIASFRSTLEELHEADLLVHVVDGSSAQARDQLQVTEQILKDLGVDTKPRMTVLNKADQFGGGVSRNWAKIVAPGAISVSALNQEDVYRLRDAILAHFRGRMEVWEVLIPYGESRLEASLHAHASVEKTSHLEKGTFYRLRIDEGWARKLALERYRL